MLGRVVARITRFARATSAAARRTPLVFGQAASMLEGSRAFEIAWGAITGTICFTLGTIVIVRWLAARRSGAASIFGRAVDPHRRLQLAYGIFAMGMGGTNYGCRFIDHRYLEGVHEGFAAITFVVVALLVSRLVVSRRSAVT
jgi:hypothetical protein